MEGLAMLVCVGVRGSVGMCVRGLEVMCVYVRGWQDDFFCVMRTSLYIFKNFITLSMTIKYIKKKRNPKLYLK